MGIWEVFSEEEMRVVPTVNLANPAKEEGGRGETFSVKELASKKERLWVGQ